ncbi:DUF2332 domain-containing protein [Roseateles toxinivorans]|uniref:DUF2332 domain-containing protein n=1 Tax=Roseateles toxinivorans TaxID=270368 RepID=A0A4R6QHF4_9BURK|nr:DUF2332 domain-containing protein [Roseateles toxinivorans]TDP61517.1 hypothetical protein DES47_11266 [Roseateles toxinivorans]
MTSDTPSFRAAQAAGYRHFAAQECADDPLYVAICLAVADSPELLELMLHAPGRQRRPNLLLAALHERILAGVPHGLAAYYPSVGGQRLPDAELPALLLDFARQQGDLLVRYLQTRSTQTNEIGRCAVLWPALQQIARLSGRPDLALLDFGSSAGLNLGVDGYHYDYGRFQLGAPAAPGRPQIRCEWLGDAPPLRADLGWRITRRLGLDLSPIDVSDDDAVRWLAACLWPHDRERALRLDQAVALARAAGHRVRRADDCIAEIEPWLDTLPAGVQPVLFNSWVLAYFPAEELARYQAEVGRLVRSRGLAWLSAESPSLRPTGLALPPTAPGASPHSLWSLVWRDRTEALAWSHPHGRWVQWLG